MSIEAEIDELQKPLSAAKPCGEDLEDTQLLASFDGFRLFGRSVPLPPETDWRDIKAKSFAAMRSSKDFRLLGYFAAASLRLDGWSGFLGAVHVAATWIKEYWSDLYPRVDDDAILRKNALNSLSDRMSVLDGLRRLPIVEHRQLGRISLRDVDLATGKMPAAESDTSPATEAQVNAVFVAAALEELRANKSRLEGGIADLTAIDTAMRNFGGTAASPDFEPLLVLLKRIRDLLAEQLALRAPAVAVAAAADAAGKGAAGAEAVGFSAINSRQDAMRALDAIVLFFRQTEPSSPIPLFLERAKNLIGKDFLEILASIAPEGVATARNAGGLKD